VCASSDYSIIYFSASSWRGVRLCVWSSKCVAVL
jgi:hypothetical protein